MNQRDKSHAQEPQTWVSILTLLPSLLWTIVGLVVAYEIGPDVWHLFKQGAITKIGIGSLTLELVQRRLSQVKGLDNFGIPKEVQDQLQRRFANIGDYAGDVHILWVDDNHPYQNRDERRVLSPLSISVDTATSTKQALDGLGDLASYDILITDLRRVDDPRGKCSVVPDAKERAGCDLINQVRALPGGPALPIIVYAGEIDGVINPAKNLAVTNTAGDLFNAIIDAIERIKRR